MKKCCENFCCTKITDLSVYDGQTVIIENINLHIHCGEITAVIGPNGAGKSTFFKTLIGAREHSGSIEFEGHDQNTAKDVKTGYVPQSLTVDKDVPVSVMDLFMSAISGRPSFIKQKKSLKQKIYDTLKTIDAEHLINNKVSDLSGGEMQRILLGLALMPMPNVLLLDEPVSGIDKIGEYRFLEVLSRLRSDNDLAIVLISHDLNIVKKYADKVVLLNKKILAVGTPDEVFESSEFTNIFGEMN